MWRPVLLSSVILAFAAAGLAETHVVNPEGTGDFPTIQAAIDAVVDGDIIELTNGTFTGEGNRDIDYLGKAITIGSRSGNPEACIIDCEASSTDPHRGFYFRSGEGLSSVLRDLTVTNAYQEGADPEYSGRGDLLFRVLPYSYSLHFLEEFRLGRGRDQL
jgi:hypothetical protein